MNPKLIKRLDAIEAAINQATIPRLVLIDVDDLSEPDRDRYWAGDESVLGLPNHTGEGIRAVIIDMHPDTRDAWLETRGMSDEEMERYEERQVRESEREERELLTSDSVPEVRYDYSGYPLL